MKYQADHDFHIHSLHSLCSHDPEQTPERILQYARENGLKTICLTDHFWDEKIPGASEWYKGQDYAHICSAKPLPQDENIRFLFGCETEMDKFTTIGISKERMEEFDFIIIPTTHLHMTGFTIDTEENSTDARAARWASRFEALLDKDLPFHKVGIAHLACRLIMRSSREDYIRVLDAIPQDDMERLFTRAAEVGCGIELNSDDMRFSDEEADSVLRMFRIAKACGCKFYLGSDAHHPSGLDTAKPVFEKAIDLLGLTEDDKFLIG